MSRCFYDFSVYVRSVLGFAMNMLLAFWYFACLFFTFCFLLSTILHVYFLLFASCFLLFCMFVFCVLRLAFYYFVCLFFAFCVLLLAILYVCFLLFASCFLLFCFLLWHFLGTIPNLFCIVPNFHTFAYQIINSLLWLAPPAIKIPFSAQL